MMYTKLFEDIYNEAGLLRTIGNAIYNKLTSNPTSSQPQVSTNQLPKNAVAQNPNSVAPNPQNQQQTNIYKLCPVPKLDYHNLPTTIRGIDVTEAKKFFDKNIAAAESVEIDKNRKEEHMKYLRDFVRQYYEDCCCCMTEDPAELKRNFRLRPYLAQSIEKCVKDIKKIKNNEGNISERYKKIIAKFNGNNPSKDDLINAYIEYIENKVADALKEVDDAELPENIKQKKDNYDEINEQEVRERIEDGAMYMKYIIKKRYEVLVNIKDTGKLVSELDGFADKSEDFIADGLELLERIKKIFKKNK